MNDVINRLASLQVEAGQPSDALVERRVRAARTALRRRTAVRSGLGAACLVTAVGVGLAVAPSTPDAPAVSATGAVRLVDYTGPQEQGFTVAKVPAGFVLQGSTAYSLDVASKSDTSPLGDFRNKLVVMLEAPTSTEPPADGGDAPADAPTVDAQPGDAPTTWSPPQGGTDDAPTLPAAPTKAGQPASAPVAVGGPGKKVTVGDASGRLATSSTGAKTLRYPDGDMVVTVQEWPTLGLSDAQLIEFAEGITVTDQAKPSVG